MKTFLLIAATVFISYVFYVLLYGIYYRIKTGTPQKTNYPLMLVTIAALAVLLIIYVQKGYYQH